MLETLGAIQRIRESSAREEQHNPPDRDGEYEGKGQKCVHQSSHIEVFLSTSSEDLQTFREALAVLQRQVDELDELKARHYQEIVEHEEEVWDFVQGKVCLAVRSTMDVFDRLTSKAYVILRFLIYAPSLMLIESPVPTQS